MSGSEHARPARELDYRDQVRLVPMTGQQRDWIFKAASVLDAHEELGSIGNAWDAAPADPTEAVREAIASCFSPRERSGVVAQAEIKFETDAVLRALGCAKDPA